MSIWFMVALCIVDNKYSSSSDILDGSSNRSFLAKFVRIFDYES